VSHPVRDPRTLGTSRNAHPESQAGTLRARRPPSAVRSCYRTGVSDERDLVAEFEAAYATTPPWDIGRPQPAFASLAAERRLAGRALDVGCGTGEHVLMAAEAGCDAVGIDISSTAIRLAEAKAEERGTPARFIVGDARQLESLGEKFDVVLDCGLFHVFDDEDRLPFVDSLARVVRPGGSYFMLCFSEAEPAGWGPRRVTQAEIRAAFARGWRVESIEPTELHVTIRAEPARSWFASITRN
jgi:ubiquinone/menaquinone biosynthesis C-methylase UbiE